MELLTRASRDPLESVTTEADTPRLLLLIDEARSVRVSPVVPLPVLKVVVVPLSETRLSCIAPSGAVALATEGEYQEAAVARLLTVMEWVPTVAPEVAVAVTAELEEPTVRAAREPSRLLRSSASVDSVVSAVWIEVRAVIWDLTVVCSVCHCRSGACAA